MRLKIRVEVHHKLNNVKSNENDSHSFGLQRGEKRENGSIMRPR